MGLKCELEGGDKGMVERRSGDENTASSKIELELAQLTESSEGGYRRIEVKGFRSSGLR